MESRARAMQTIENADFVTRPIMNKSEFRHFIAMETALGKANLGHRLMAQVSLAELVRPDGKDPDRIRAAFRELNTRRVDFVAVDRSGRAAVAIEYQGHGHYQNGAFARDAIKREVIRKAGAEWMEIEADTPPEVSARALVDRLRRRGSRPRP